MHPSMPSSRLSDIFRLNFLIDSIQARKDLEKDSSCVLGSFLNQMGPHRQILLFSTQEPIFLCSVPIKHMNYYKDPQKLELLDSLSGFYRCASPQCSVRTARTSTSTQTTPLTPKLTQTPHALAKYTKEPWLYPPSPLTNKCSFVGRAQAPHMCYPSSIHSSNGLGCIV